MKREEIIAVLDEISEQSPYLEEAAMRQIHNGRAQVAFINLIRTSEQMQLFVINSVAVRMSDEMLNKLATQIAKEQKGRTMRPGPQSE